MVEAVVSPEWEDRYYSFNGSWSPGEEMASMRNGSGDDWFILFGPFGAGIKGLAHETTLAGDMALLAEIPRQIPSSFSSFLNEPAFDWKWLSYCYWRGVDDSAWHRVVHPEPQRAQADDGSEEFLALLIEPPAAYVDFAHWYYELDVPIAAVEAVYANASLTPSLVSALNSKVTLERVRADATEIGYPILSTDA